MTQTHLYEPQPEREFTNRLSPQEVGFITSLAQDVSITQKNMAAIESGFFDTASHDWMGSELQKLKSAQQLHSLKSQPSADIWRLVKNGKLTLITPKYFEETKREAHAVGVKTLGLSKGANVRHGNRKHIDRFVTRSRRLPPRSKTISHCGVNVTDEYRVSSEPQTGWILNEQKHLEWQPVGTSRAYLMRRDWAKQIKMQVVYHPSPSDAPAPQTGERFTEKLNGSAVKKIFESGAYVAACRGGFSTFLTLTFSEAQRAHLFGGEALTEEGLAYCPIQTTIGREVSRFLDGVKKAYERGFEYKPAEIGQLNLNGEKVKVSGHLGRPLKAKWVEDGIKKEQELYGPTKKPFDFHYIWVAECPANADGEPNPHVHLLLQWSVEPQHFQAWAKRLESLWGHGFAHLERIKYTEAAAGYLIKAVGYAAKGGNADQGLIKGNRYNIARCSRAPAWDVLESFDVDNMTGIIKECAYKLERWRKPMQKDIARKQRKKDESIKAISINRKQGNMTAVNKLQRLITLLEEESRVLKQTIKSRGVYANSQSNFSITFEGDNALEKMDDFMLWAHGARGWTLNANEIDLEPCRQYAKQHYSTQLNRFLLKQADWKSQLTQDIPPLRTQEVQETIESIAAEERAEYEAFLVRVNQ